MIRFTALIVIVVVSAARVDAATVVTSSAGEQTIIRELPLTGTVTSPGDALLSPAVAGLVQEVQVNIGDRVAKGDRLMQLDAELQSLMLEADRAAQAEARSALAEARRRLAEADRLRSDNSIAETEVESRRTQVALNEAAFSRSAANAKASEVLVKRHTLRAPFAGVISAREAEPGEWVSPGDAVLRLVATESLWFEFRVPQDIYSSLRIGEPVRLSVAAAEGAVFAGEIASIVPVNDPDTRSFLLRAVASGDESDNESGAVLPGMSARALLSIETGRTAVVVPRDALLRSSDGRDVVFTVQRQSDEIVAREHVVETGLEFDGQVEIRSGIAPGEEVIVRGNEVLRDGQAVTLR